MTSCVNIARDVVSHVMLSASTLLGNAVAPVANQQLQSWNSRLHKPLLFPLPKRSSHHTRKNPSPYNVTSFVVSRHASLHLVEHCSLYTPFSRDTVDPPYIELRYHDLADQLSPPRILPAALAIHFGIRGAIFGAGEVVQMHRIYNAVAPHTTSMRAFIKPKLRS
jgi:hypothetical protein